MTFIIAIQLNDSIIIAADNKAVSIKTEERNKVTERYASKLHKWDKGIITGTGEGYVISRSIALFKELAKSQLKHLPDCLKLSRKIREHEIGLDYFQVKNTKLICTSYSQDSTQLYKVECLDDTENYTMTAMEPMEILVWMFDPNIETIIEDLRNLYKNLRDQVSFSNQTDWMSHYISHIAPIYQKQSRQDSLMSESFDILFQSKDEYIFEHVPNMKNISINFQKTSSIINSI